MTLLEHRRTLDCMKTTNQFASRDQPVFIAYGTYNFLTSFDFVYATLGHITKVVTAYLRDTADDGNLSVAEFLTAQYTIF